MVQLLDDDGHRGRGLSPGAQSRAATGLLVRRCCRLEVVDQAAERRLERVVILPVREVGDEILPDLDAQVLPAVRVETLPIPEGIEVHEADREELAAFPLERMISV